MLTLYIDFKSPASYLAIKPTLALAQRYDVEIAWRPFMPWVRPKPALSGKETIAETHFRVRAASKRANHIKYAARLGIDLQFPEPAGETALALGVLAILKADPLPFIHAAFDAYWVQHQNLDDEETVAGLYAASGYDATMLDFDHARKTLPLAQAEAEEQGVVEAPAYLIDEQIFIGRQHLPWIEEILQTL